MIEFRAECGHTVRARDEDAGGVVRCSYCGRDADVPDTGSADLDVLLTELGKDGQSDGVAVATRGGARRGMFSKRRGEPTDVFGLALKLCYGTALFIILVLVWQYGLKDVLGGRDSHRPPLPPGLEANAGGGGANTRQLNSRQGTAGRSRHGLTGIAGATGLYVGTVPKGGQVFYIDQQRAPAHGRIQRLPGCRALGLAGRTFPCQDGVYVVEIAFTWSDASLKSLQGYRDFRQEIRRVDARGRQEAIAAYFVPDGADLAFVDEDADGQIYLIRQYRNVEVRNGKSQGVRSLFLPRVPASDGDRFSVDALLAGHDFTMNAYTFRSEENVRDELEFFGVAPKDISSVIRALHRLGVAPYELSEGDDVVTMLFMIGIHDGAFTPRELRRIQRP